MKKLFLWLFSIVMIIATGFFITGYYLNKNWQPLLEEQLKLAVINSTDSLYRIEYKSLDVNPLNGNLKLIDFKLIPVMRIYEKLKLLQEAPDNLYKLEVDALVIRDANAKEAVETKRLQIENIIIAHPQLIIINDRQPYNDTIAVVKKRKNPYELIKDIFRELKINNIALNDINFTFINKNEKKEKITSLKNLDITVNDILIDSISILDSSRIYYTKDIQIKIKNYQIATPDSLYYVKVNNLNFSTFKNELVINKIEYTPRLNKVNFYKKVGYAKDRFDLTFNKIILRNIDFDLFLKQQKLYAKTVNISNAKVDVYNNNAYPKRRTNKTGKFPHQQFLKVALDMRIATIKLANVDISYSEYDAKSKRTGRIDFKNTSGTITNVANDAASLAKNSIMRANLKSMVFGKAPLNINLKFYMKSKIGAFDYSGTLYAFNGKIINNIVTPLGMAEIKSADVKKLSFYAQADQYKARGKIQFYYNDLNVTVLKRDDEGNLKKQGLISTIANKFIIKEQNPNKRGEFTEGNISYERPVYASFFNYLWQSMFTGIKESVGVSQKRESKLKQKAEDAGILVNDVKQAVADIKEKLKEDKAERLERKEDRKEKKQEKVKLKEKEKTAKDTITVE